MIRNEKDYFYKCNNTGNTGTYNIYGVEHAIKGVQRYVSRLLSY